VSGRIRVRQKNPAAHTAGSPEVSPHLGTSVAAAHNDRTRFAVSGGWGDMILQVLRWMVWLVGKTVSWMRYRVTVVGLPEVLAKPGPYLVLPNHPSFSDPPNLAIQLWPTFRFRPLALETNFQSPFVKPFAWLSDAILIPDLDKASADSRERLRVAIGTIAAILRSGENVLVWPSGRLMRDGVERLGGTRAVAELLAAVPEATVVLVRTRGLWGSMFSVAPTAAKPALVPTLVSAVGMLLSNLLLFTPRRRVTTTLEAFRPDERPPPDRLHFNRWLEAWYNADTGGGPEAPTWVPHHFLFGPRDYVFPPPPQSLGHDLSKVKPETKRAVAEIVEAKLERPLTTAEDAAETTFQQLGLDSLDGMEMALHVEQRFGFRGDEMPTTLGQLWALCEGLVERAPAKPAPPEWFHPPRDYPPTDVLGETFGEAFVNRCVRDGPDVAAADDIAGVLTYEKLFVASRALAERFRQYPESNIGLLMPASVAGDLALVALHLAGKLPVVLNWTTGPGNLAHAVMLTGVTRVVTAKAFVDRTQLEVPGAEFVYLEQIRQTIGRFELLKSLLALRWFPAAAARRALEGTIRDPNAAAVVLFTSGSEKAPKAVPLTHANVIANMRATIPRLGITKNDSVLGFLPLFHSFGHTVTGLFPLFGGVKVVHHPDPTDSAALVRKIAGYKVTLTAGTPTFFQYILDRAKPGDLDTLKIVALGAEKCPDSVFEKGRQFAPNAKLVEGYGITECSPIISFNPLEAPKRGTIGKPLEGVELRVVDVETNRPVPAGEMGMLLVAGPNVFPGYVGFDGPSPFEEHDGKRYYITGDLVALDPDGYIVFRGRLKRFLKAGGEMISLPALEEPFSKLYPPTDEGPRVAVEGVETPDGRRIVLFTTENLDLTAANKILLAEGFRGVLRLDEVRRVEKIPVLGTGKIDYKVLRAQIAPEAS